MNPVQDLKQTREPGILLQYQIHWVEDKSDVKVMEKSRRVGLTWSEAADDALFAGSAEFPGRQRKT